MSLICRNRQSCENPFRDKVLVMDANALLNICDTAICGISGGITPRQRFQNFCWILEGILSNIQSCCFGGKLHTTKEVYDDEMTPMDRSSTIRNYTPFTEICGNDSTNYSHIAKVFGERFQLPTSNIARTQIEALKQQAGAGPNLIHNMPSDHDFGLLVLSLQKAIERETVLITDDSNLQKVFENICRVRYISLSSETIDTMMVFSTSSLSYLKHIYGCCRIINRDYFCLIQTVSDWTETLRSASNPLYLQYERELEQIIRDVAKYNK